MTSNPKPSRTARQLQTRKRRRDRKNAEGENKKQARKRDLHRCRFPLCGCRRLGLPLEVSHDRHKGMGGDPTGERSSRELLILMCAHRHQHGAVSFHKGTLRTRYLSPAKNDGPIAFEVDLDVVSPGSRIGDREARWCEVARERAVQELEWLTPKQQVILERLAEMQL